MYESEMYWKPVVAYGSYAVDVFPGFAYLVEEERSAFGLWSRQGRTYKAECSEAAAVFGRIASASVVWIVTSETGLCGHLCGFGVQIVATVALGRVAVSVRSICTCTLSKLTFGAILHAEVVVILTL
jgi:hypothetical protein